MGQQANGILYGCEAPDLPQTPDDDEPLYDLIQRWEKAKKITWETTGPRIREESEGGKSLLGVWVAIGGSGEDDAPYFLEQCMRLNEVEIVYADSIRKASKLWERFAAHVQKKEMIILPNPQLWLTPCETA